MGNLLYVVAVILFILWAVGYFAYSAGSMIHILLVIAIIAILFNVIQAEESFKIYKGEICEKKFNYENEGNL